jgi:hypothetical protein
LEVSPLAKGKKSAVEFHSTFELRSNELDSPKQKRQLGTAQRVGADAFEIAIFRLELLLCGSSNFF